MTFSVPTSSLVTSDQVVDLEEVSVMGRTVIGGGISRLSSLRLVDGKTKAMARNPAIIDLVTDTRYFPSIMEVLPCGRTAIYGHVLPSSSAFKYGAIELRMVKRHTAPGIVPTSNTPENSVGIPLPA